MPGDIKSFTCRLSHYLLSASLLSLLAAASTGCYYKRTGDLVAYELVRRTAGGEAEIPFWTEDFENNVHKWPRNLDELRSYVKNKSSGQLALTYYQDATFEELSNGHVRVRCFRKDDEPIDFKLMTQAQRAKAKEQR